MFRPIDCQLAALLKILSFAFKQLLLLSHLLMLASYAVLLSSLLQS